MIPVLVAITVLVVVLRRGFNIGSIALQESIIYLHAWIFLVAMAYTLRADGQVRVDIFYRKFSASQQAWVNAIGGLVLLLPLCVVLLVTTSQYALRSWQIRRNLRRRRRPALCIPAKKLYATGLRPTVGAMPHRGGRQHTDVD